VTSAPLPPAALDDAFALATHSYIFLIGGGGKTTLMFTLAHHLSRAGHTVISTTSTRILYPSPQDAARVIIEADPARAATQLRSELPEARHIALAKTLCNADRKLCGHAADELDALRQAHVAHYILVEADGAAGRSLKAHADHEPVISTQADLVIAVIGTDCIGHPLDDAHVHRAARFAQLLNRAIGAPLAPDDVAAIFFHPLGYLKAVPPAADLIVLLSKAGVAAQRANAPQLATALRAADHDKRIARIVLGELAGPHPFVERIP
jgi:probable selenium-dependent hydroxylase accessory protein YqeC